MKADNKSPSDTIQSFLELLKECKSVYEICTKEVWKYDKRQQDQLHDLEFASNYDERNKVATRIHKDRTERRKYKDRVARVEKLAKFYSDKQNKQFIDRLKAMLEEQRKIEEYLDGERHYNRRGGDNVDNN